MTTFKSDDFRKFKHLFCHTTYTSKSYPIPILWVWAREIYNIILSYY